MNEEVLSVIVVVAMAVVLIRAILKLPRKVGIPVGVIMLLFTAAIIYMGVYHNDVLNGIVDKLE